MNLVLDAHGYDVNSSILSTFWRRGLVPSTTRIRWFIVSFVLKPRGTATIRPQPLMMIWYSNWSPQGTLTAYSSANGLSYAVQMFTSNGRIFYYNSRLLGRTVCHYVDLPKKKKKTMARRFHGLRRKNEKPTAEETMTRTCTLLDVRCRTGKMPGIYTYIYIFYILEGTRINKLHALHGILSPKVTSPVTSRSGEPRVYRILQYRI